MISHIASFFFVALSFCLIPWINKFLSDRKQRVKLNQIFSDWLLVKVGVSLMSRCQRTLAREPYHPPSLHSTI